MSKESYHFNEDFLQFVWQHKLYDFSQMFTICDKKVEIIHPGYHNTDSGPDFFNAKIRVDDMLWAGNVELHLKSNEWTAHKHHEDKAYDNVILHVVSEYNTPVFSHKGNEIPTLVINPLPFVLQQYKDLLFEKRSIPCSSYLHNIDPIFLTNFKDRLIVDRLQRKITHIQELFKVSHGDWEAVFLPLLFRSFGLSINGDAFERLGRSISHKIVAKHRDSLLQLEALLFGQAGFLEEDINDVFFLTMKREYLFLKAKYNLCALEKHNWKFLRLRPSNFPTIRISQLAHLLHQNDSILNKILFGDVQHMDELFYCKVSPYWQYHYIFGKLSDPKQKLLGKTAIHSIMINTIAPLLYSYGMINDQSVFCENAIVLLEKLPAEKNTITKKWSSYGVSLHSASDSQAMIQLYTEFCLPKRCLHCNIGHHYLSLQH